MSNGYVNIKGRGLKFVQGSIAELRKKLATLTPEKVDAWGAQWLVHFGLVGNCTVKEQEVDFTFEQTVEWYETLSDEEIAQIVEVYQSTKYYVKDIPEKESTKKKLVKKK